MGFGHFLVALVDYLADEVFKDVGQRPEVMASSGFARAGEAGASATGSRRWRRRMAGASATTWWTTGRLSGAWC